MAASSRTDSRNITIFILKTKPSMTGAPLTYLSTPPLPPFQRPEVQAGKSPFNRLPAPLFISIVRYLPDASLLAFALTCHATNFILQPLLRFGRLVYLGDGGLDA
ncbi:hypothetical protein EJ06DRAFT_35509 [Trichodelitschia bisporula]|uniref:F-box domain-containing protein n=1 Tax=Trichodelitschia bisporula TaxID=703511 RepID=A0A6G1HVG0_9PEZI|nr:hypothetical protein EJ06DRAFT_35509 [Trichodelitschia bisporula]